MTVSGVLLYILMFGENPFYDALDTVRAELHPPHLEVFFGLVRRKYMTVMFYSMTSGRFA
jgi:hypothetical protein